MEIIIAFIVLAVVFAVFWYFANKQDKKNAAVSFEDPTLQFHALTTAAPVAEEGKLAEVVAPVAPVVEEVKPVAKKAVAAEVKTVAKKAVAMRTASTKVQQPQSKNSIKKPATSTKSTKIESTPVANKKAKDTVKLKTRKQK